METKRITKATLIIYSDQLGYRWELDCLDIYPLTCVKVYKNEKSAKRAARRWAQRHNIQVVDVVKD